MLKKFKNSFAQKKGVKLPKLGTQKYHTLEFLCENVGEVVNKSIAEKKVFQRLGIQSKDLQSLRHLGKQDGFAILQANDEHKGYKLKRGEYLFKGFDEVNPYWDFKRRNEKDLDFLALKKKYNNQCASCGSKEGFPHRYTKQVVKLEKGHMNPSFSMNQDNVIPQCSYCNQIAKDKWIFDKCGFAKYMTLKGLLSHPEKDQEKFYQALRKKFQ